MSALESRPQICLFQPEIPQNTGSIGRLSLATGCPLHLVKPLGFSMDDHYVKRAGLDYWQYVDVNIHENFNDYLQTFVKTPRFAFFSTKATKPFWDMPQSDVLVFGRETKGLPEIFWQEYPDNFYTIPMYHPKVRSLNLAMSVGIVVYQQIYQRKGLSDAGT